MQPLATAVCGDNITDIFIPQLLVDLVHTQCRTGTGGDQTAVYNLFTVKQNAFDCGRTAVDT